MSVIRAGSFLLPSNGCFAFCGGRSARSERNRDGGATFGFLSAGLGRWVLLQISTEYRKVTREREGSVRMGRVGNSSHGRLVDVLEVTNLGLLRVELEVSIDGALPLLEVRRVERVVEKEGDLLERESLGLDEAEVDDDEEDNEGAEEDCAKEGVRLVAERGGERRPTEVVLPASGFEGDRVDPLVDAEGGILSEAEVS
jgi:hypothetical protein